MRAYAAILAQGIALGFCGFSRPPSPGWPGECHSPCPGLGGDTAKQLGWAGLEGAVPSGTHCVAGKGALARGASSCCRLRACLAVGARGALRRAAILRGVACCPGGGLGCSAVRGTLGSRLWAPTLAVGHRGLAFRWVSLVPVLPLDTGYPSGNLPILLLTSCA